MSANYGPCCICEGTRNVRNIVAIAKQSPHGQGWGCVVCNLAPIGASAIVCDKCIENFSAGQLRFYCVPDGDDYVSGRAPTTELEQQPEHKHNMELHQDDRPPADPTAPKYWMHETGGELRRAVERYLTGSEMSIHDCRLVILYLQQWVNSPVWDANPIQSVNSKRKLSQLREGAAAARTRDDIEACTHLAVDLGLDPF
jgi:hypothetical protein